MGKLMRDKIPQIITDAGKKPITEILDQERYLEELDKKLEEEVAEYQADKSIEKMADVLEVLFAICEARWYSVDELMRVREEKCEKCGGFKDRVYWVGVRSRIMLEKVWEFIKENVAAIITVVTAILTVVYAVLRLCMFVYWKGYFTRLNIDGNLMNLNFDKSIFAVIFVSVILFIVIFFMVWVFEIINDIKQKEKEKSLKGINKFFDWVIAFGKGLGLSFIILSIVNVPLIMLLVSVTGIDITMSNKMFLFVLLYIAEMLFIFTQKTTIEQHEKNEKTAEKDIAIKVIEILAFVLITLAALFYGGNQAIDKKTSVQLVENEEYMISYCDGDCYVLHKVDYIEGKIIVYINEQKIVNVENYEVIIKQIEEIDIRE